MTSILKIGLFLRVLGYLFILKFFKSSKPVEISIAVLPFENMTSDPEQESLSDGITEEINNMLAQVPELKVTGRASSFSFKGKNQDLRTIGNQLNVNHILEGSVQKSGNKLRITAKLIKVSDGYQVWSERYDQQLEDIFDIQDKISLAILNAIKIKLFGAAKEAVFKKYTGNPEAYQLYLQGRFYYNKFAGATTEYKKAIELNPNSAEAHASYAMYLALLGNYTEAIKHASIAYSLDPFSIPINDNIASVYWSSGDYVKGIEYGRRLIKLEPNFYGGHFRVGQGLMYLKRYEEAVPEFEIAVHQNSSSITLRYLGVIYAIIGEKVKAREMLEKMEILRSTQSTQWVGNCDIGTVYVALGEFDTAYQYYEKALVDHEGFMLYLKYYFRLFPEFEKDPRAKQLLEKIGLPYL